MSIVAQPTETPYALAGDTLGPFSTVWFYEQASDVRVWLDAGAGALAQLAAGVDYTLTATAPLTAGGSVTLSSALLAGGTWPANARLVLQRVQACDQASVYGQGAGFSPLSSEQALDHVARAAQQLATLAARSLSLSPGETGAVLPPASQRAGMALAFDAHGAPVLIAPGASPPGPTPVDGPVLALSGGAYTLSSTWDGYNLLFTNAGGATVTLPNNLPVGFSCLLIQGAAGVVTTTAQAGGSQLTPSGGASTVATGGGLRARVLTNGSGANAQWTVAPAPQLIPTVAPTAVTAISSPNVASAFANAPAGGESVGTVYVVGASPSGAFTGQANAIAYLQAASQWVFTPPQTGQQMFLQNPGREYTYGSGTWTQNPVPTAVQQFAGAVAAATTGALAANTYANGTAGVGATLSGNSNGALAAIDGVTPTVGMRLLIQNEAAASHNGIYVVTTVGSAGAPYVLTRASDANTAALLGNTGTFVSGGSTLVGNTYAEPLPAGSITMGTTALNFVLVNGPGGIAAETARALAAEAAEATTRAAADTALAAQIVALPYGPNGTSQRWQDLVAAASGTASTTVKNALRDVEHRLRYMELLPKIVRLDLFVGDQAAAARIPFVQRPGCGNASLTGTISSWTQANGATGLTLDTGVTLQQAGLGTYNVGAGVYCLATPATDSGIVLGGSGWGLNPFVGSTSSSFCQFSTFDYAGRVLGDTGTLSGGANAGYTCTGAIAGLRLASGNGVVIRNGIELQGGSVSTDPAATGSWPTDSFVYGTTVIAIGGGWITDGMTKWEAAALQRIVHDFNVAIGRGVAGEGL